jgi:hypothetical protein
MTARIGKLKAILKREQKLPYLISSLTNIRYLTGFGGSYAALVVDEFRTAISYPIPAIRNMQKAFYRAF